MAVTFRSRPLTARRVLDAALARSHRFIPDAKTFIPAWRTRPGGRLPADFIRLIDEHGLFIHIPKTGGNSVSQVVYGRKIEHRPAFELLLLHPLRFFRWRRYAIVREPTDRFLSAYDYLRQGGKHERDAAFGQHYLAMEINALIQRLAADAPFRTAVMAYTHFRPQARYVSLGRLRIVRRLLPFDRMNEQMSAMGFDLPVINATPGQRTSKSGLTDASLKTLASLYASDYRLYESSTLGSMKNVADASAT